MVTIPASKEKVLFLDYKTACQSKNFQVGFYAKCVDTGSDN